MHQRVVKVTSYKAIWMTIVKNDKRGHALCSSCSISMVVKARTKNMGTNMSCSGACIYLYHLDGEEIDHNMNLVAQMVLLFVHAVSFHHMHNMHQEALFKTHCQNRSLNAFYCLSLAPFCKVCMKIMHKLHGKLISFSWHRYMPSFINNLVPICQLKNTIFSAYQEFYWCQIHNFSLYNFPFRINYAFKWVIKISFVVMFERDLYWL